MVAKWYVLRSKPRKEQVLYKSLKDKGYDVFYPRISYGVNGSREIKWVPYFPGYLFVKIDLDQDKVSSFQWMPYSFGLVCFGEKPGYVPDNLIQALGRRGRNGNSSHKPISDGVDLHDGEVGYTSYDAICSSLMNEKMVGKKRVSALLGLLEELNE
ncbi:MAG: hypothetical protein IBX69_12885 [Anaerolineales bacterium]|nr:hypothetical protein [Anaerolineales bacterium]